jgi:hypothetical protein
MRAELLAAQAELEAIANEEASKQDRMSRSGREMAESRRAVPTPQDPLHLSKPKSPSVKGGRS